MYMYFIIFFYHFFSLSGKNNTHPLKNNDEISLSLKKHKGKEFICILTSTFLSNKAHLFVERKCDKLCLATPLWYNGHANHSYENAAVELKSLEIYFCRACGPSIFLFQ